MTVCKHICKTQNINMQLIINHNHVQLITSEHHLSFVNNKHNNKHKPIKHIIIYTEIKHLSWWTAIQNRCRRTTFHPAVGNCVLCLSTQLPPASQVYESTKTKSGLFHSIPPQALLFPPSHLWHPLTPWLQSLCLSVWASVRDPLLPTGPSVNSLPGAKDTLLPKGPSVNSFPLMP